MNENLKIQNLFQKRLFVFSVLVSLLFFQLIYSFLFPSVGFNDNWQPVDTYLPKFTVESSDNFLLGKIYPLISSEYRLNSDIGHYLELGRNFSAQHFKSSPFLERPLYPFLIFLSSLPFRLFTEPSYGIIFALAVLINFILIGAAVILFFSLLKELFSLKVAWLSSILLIFSPFVHSFLNQPLAEMLMAFAVVFSVYLLFNYVKKPSVFKLIIFSLVVGTFMLGKMFFASSFFILLLAIFFKRYKEGTLFLAVHLIPLLFWYFWITQVWGLNYYSHGVQQYHMGIWVFGIITTLSWQETYRILLNTLPNFITALIYTFLLVPMIFSIIGFQKMPLRAKNVVYFGSIFSVLFLGFLIGFYYLRHVFLLFPIIYPTCILGIERVANFLGRYNRWFLPLFYAIIIGLMILISNINIYQIFDYNG